MTLSSIAVTPDLSSPWVMSKKKEKGKGRGKAIPLETWAGSEDSRTLRLTDFRTIDT